MSVSPWSADKAPVRSQWRGEEERMEKKGNEGKKAGNFFFERERQKTPLRHTEGMALVATMALDGKS